MDEQQIDPGQLQLVQALIERALEVGGGELVVIDLGGDENILAREAGGAQPLGQPLPHLGLVAVTLGGVDVAISEPQGGLDRLDADAVLERHGAEADRGNLCAVGCRRPSLRSPLMGPMLAAKRLLSAAGGRRRRMTWRCTLPERAEPLSHLSGGYWMPRLGRA